MARHRRVTSSRRALVYAAIGAVMVLLLLIALLAIPSAQRPTLGTPTSPQSTGPARGSASAHP